MSSTFIQAAVLRNSEGMRSAPGDLLFLSFLIASLTSIKDRCLTNSLFASKSRVFRISSNDLTFSNSSNYSFHRLSTSLLSFKITLSLQAVIRGLNFFCQRFISRKKSLLSLDVLGCSTSLNLSS